MNTWYFSRFEKNQNWNYFFQSPSKITMKWNPLPDISFKTLFRTQGVCILKTQYGIVLMSVPKSN